VLFLVYSVKKGSEFHATSYSLGTGGSLPEVDRPEHVLTTQHHSIPEATNQWNF